MYSSTLLRKKRISISLHSHVSSINSKTNLEALSIKSHVRYFSIGAVSYIFRFSVFKTFHLFFFISELAHRYMKKYLLNEHALIWKL